MSAELAETATAAEVVEPLNREDAEKLDQRIRRMAGDTKGKLDTLGALVADAEAGRIHEVLDGYPSWTAYLVDALGELCSGQGIETRRELVAYLYDVGMSERAIAAVTGASKTTVHRDLESAESQVVHNGPPDAGDEPETVATDLDEADEANARVSTDLPESPHTEVDAGGQTKAKTTIGLDGNSYPRGWKKRPEGQGQQKKPRSPRSENHAKGLAKLLEKSLHPAANALETLIPGDLNEGVTPEIARGLADRFERNIAIFTRVHRQLKERAGEAD